MVALWSTDPALRRRTWLATAYFFLIVTAYYLIKPVRSSLVMSALGSARLPSLYILTALVLGGLVAGYARLLRRVAPQRLMQAILAALLVQLVGFRWALQLPYGWISGLFYLWVSMFSVVAVTQFWTIADDLFSPGEAKHWFGFIGAGGIAGGIVGGALASALVRWMRSEDVLLVSAGLLGVCAVLLSVLWKFPRPQPVEAADGSPRSTNSSGCTSLLCYLKEFPYLRYLLALVMIAKGVSTIIDYQFNGLVELSVIGKEARTALFGTFYTGLNLASLVAQVALTSRLFSRLGIHRTLAVLPVGLAIGLAGLLLIPGLALAGLVALYDRSLSYSLGQTGKEVLYVPVPSAVRTQVKPLIDAAAFRLAQGAAGAVLLLAQQLGHLPPHALSVLALPLIGVWLLAIHRLKLAQPVRVT
jgi:AAA family ATP:ADP antiporter